MFCLWNCALILVVTGLNSTAGERAAIAIAGLVETFLFLTSVLGFVFQGFDRAAA